MKLALIFVFIISSINCQVTQDQQQCAGLTNIHYHCGQDGSSNQQDLNVANNLQRGYRGKSGAKGEKGMKGESGTTENIKRDLQALKGEVANLKQRLDNQVLPTSCSHINGDEDDSGHYVISPNPAFLHPFTVYCNFTAGLMETVIEHDSIQEITIDSCEPSRCYKRKIRYNISLKQIVAVIEASSECRQFIKLRCVGVQPFLERTPPIAAWLSRNGTLLKYWGGVPPNRPGYCACGLAGTCINSNQKCNCDSGHTSTEYTDEGYLTAKNDLPVTELQFGDNGDNSESGWHTLGPLICSGTRTN